jgi:Fic family protein
LGEKNFNKIIQKSALINDPYEASFFLTTHLSYLQPFVDCNKRTSRITGNISLLQNGITPISWMEAAAREKDYKEALIAVYEFNDTTLLSEVFVENFMRSVERFAIMRRSKEPSAIAAQYRTQLKEYVRAHVETGSTDIPDNVESQDQEAFTAYAEQEITALKANDMIGIRYGLSPEKIAQWMENNEENNANTPNNVYEKNK